MQLPDFRIYITYEFDRYYIMSIYPGTSRYSAIVLSILGLLIAVGPYTIYPICGDAMDGPCHATGYAEAFIGISIAVLSAASLFVESHRSREFLGLAVLALSVLSVLVVTVIIGTCDSDMMACNRTGRPGMIASGAVAAVVSAVNLLLIKSDSRRIRCG